LDLAAELEIGHVNFCPRIFVLVELYINQYGRRRGERGLSGHHV
jgi:hypothetical protein